MNAKICSGVCERVAFSWTFALIKRRFTLMSLVNEISVNIDPNEKDTMHALRKTKYQAMTYWNAMAPTYPSGVLQSNGNLQRFKVQLKFRYTWFYLIGGHQLTTSGTPIERHRYPNLWSRRLICCQEILAPQWRPEPVEQRQSQRPYSTSSIFHCFRNRFRSFLGIFALKHFHDLNCQLNYIQCDQLHTFLERFFERIDKCGELTEPIKETQISVGIDDCCRGNRNRIDEFSNGVGLSQ